MSGTIDIGDVSDLAYVRLSYRCIDVEGQTVVRVRAACRFNRLRVPEKNTKHEAWLSGCCLRLGYSGLELIDESRSKFERLMVEPDVTIERKEVSVRDHQEELQDQSKVQVGFGSGSGSQTEAEGRSDTVESTFTGLRPQLAVCGGSSEDPFWQYMPRPGQRDRLFGTYDFELADFSVKPGENEIPGISAHFEASDADVELVGCAPENRLLIVTSIRKWMRSNDPKLKVELADQLRQQSDEVFVEPDDEV